MIFFKPNPDDPFSKKAWCEYVFAPFVVFLILAVLCSIYLYDQNISKEDYNKGIILLWIIGLTAIISVIYGAYHFSVCKSKHLELLEKYGDNYRTLLKEKLNYSSIRGSLFKSWEDYEEELKSMTE